MGYKYDLNTRVKAEIEMLILGFNEETGEEYEFIIPVGAEGIIESCGRSSVHNFKAMYDVMFKFGDEEREVSFFQNDLEESCEIMNAG